jgi:hypothetical protein
VAFWDKQFVSVTVWEPAHDPNLYESVDTIEGRVMGRVDRKKMPPAIEAIPAGSIQRISAIDAYDSLLVDTLYPLIMRHTVAIRLQGDIVSTTPNTIITIRMRGI